MATANGVASGALVRGMRVEDLMARGTIADNVQAGSLDGLGTGQVALGSRMAFRMGLRLGDRVMLISPKGTPTALGTVPRMTAYEIGAIF
jgi:lipoprotein-releasing system permease protein